MQRLILGAVLLGMLMGVFYVGLGTWWLVRQVNRTLFKKIELAFIGAGLLIPVVIFPVWTLINRHGSATAIFDIQDIALVLWPTSIVLMLPAGPAWSLSTVIIIVGLCALGNVAVYGTIGLIVAWISVDLHNHFENARRKS